jgi:ZIP family zinc transporter
LVEAFFWGSIAASTLLLGSLVALRFSISTRTLGLLTGFGSGALISAVAYELVLEATEASSDQIWVVLGFGAGTLTFFAADTLLTGNASEPPTDSAAMAKGVVVGSVLDGIPEATVLGISVAAGGGVSLAMLVSVLLSNFPEGVMATNGMARAGISRIRILMTWFSIALLSGIAATVGYSLADVGANFVAFTLALAGGAVITMVADSMLPEAYKDTGLLTGPAVALGFAVAFAVHAMA